MSGIKSLNERINNLESSISNYNETKSFEPSFIAYAQKKDSEEKRRYRMEKYDEIIDCYQKEVKTYIEDPIKQFTKLVEITVHFVEKYIPKICQIFMFHITSDTKLNFALELIKIVVDIVNEIIDSDFIKNSINHFVMIMNERKIEFKSQNQKQKKKRKKKFFETIKSISLR